MTTVHVIRDRVLGDVLWTEPVLRQLASSHDRVVLHSSFAGLFDGYDLPNVAFRPRLRRTERLVRIPVWSARPGVRVVDLDLSYERRPRLHPLHAYQDAAGVPRTRDVPRLPVRPPDAALAREIRGPFAALHVSGASPRNYRKVHGLDWDEVARFLRAHGLDVVQVGLEAPPVAGARPVRTSLPGLVSLLARAAVFVGVDSGPAHVAAALGRPAAVFFGAVDPELRHFPERFRGAFLRRPCAFAGCYHESRGTAGPSCRIVGDAGVPPCALHATADVLRALRPVLDLAGVP